jgi:hypothetical protein
MGSAAFGVVDGPEEQLADLIVTAKLPVRVWTFTLARSASSPVRSRWPLIGRSGS